MSSLSWWNSVEVLSRWTYWLTGTAALLGLLGACAALGAWRLGTRLGELKDAEIAQLQLRTKTRHVTDRASLLAKLPSMVGAQAPAYLFVSAYDMETREYAEELRHLLDEKGWNVSSSVGSFPSSPGVAVFLPTAENPTFTAAAKVKEALKESQILTYDVRERPSFAQMDTMVILVGRRP